jgi:iron complex outermembrane receptor protein
VAGRVSKADGYIKPGEGSDGQALGGENGWALRGTIQADLGSKGKIDLWVKHSQDDHVATGGYVFDNCNMEANGYCSTDAAGLSNGTGGVINGLTGEKASPWTNYSNTPGYLNRKVDVYQGKVGYDLGFAKLTSISNYTWLHKAIRKMATAPRPMSSSSTPKCATPSSARNCASRARPRASAGRLAPITSTCWCAARP